MNNNLDSTDEQFNDNSTISAQKDKKEKLWTPSFFILWQGQLVSTLGDAVYSIALGFWVLATTGSTALMGTLMAASTLPGVLVSPFAGVLIDRYNRKYLLILMDIVRGLSIILLTVSAFQHFIAIWMVFAAGIILSVCGALFGPGVNSAVPDLVPKSKLTNANSLFAIVSTGSNMIGSVAGGFLYQIFGAPLLFLFDGLSFFFSGGSVFFVKIPRNKNKEQQNFFKDMGDGFHFMWKLKGLRYSLIMAAVLNFFSFIAIVLFMPLFQKTTYLGAGKYGVAMACYMGGAMIGYLASSIVSIPTHRKLSYFTASIIIFTIAIILAINQYAFSIMIILILISGFFNSIVNVILMSTVQAATPSEMRGKVMAFMNMICQGLTPFAMALGGILGGLFPIKAVISVAFLVVLSIAIPFCSIKSFKDYISFDYEKDNIEDLI